MTVRRSSRLRRILAYGAAVFVLLHVAIAAYFVTHQEILVYHPIRTVEHTPADVGLDYDDVRIETEDGEILTGYYVYATRRPARGVVLYCHGNAGNVGHRVRMAALLAHLGVDVLLFDYRGFGTSTGTPTEDGTYRDAKAAFRHLVRDRGLSSDRIVPYGRSLGGPIAASVAADEDVAGLVLDATFVSIPALVRATWPSFLVVERAITFRYDTAAFLARVDEPVLVLHGPEDRTIPFEQGRRLAGLARDATFAVTRGGHGDGPHRHPEAWRAPLAAFFDRVLPP
ncbi:MAG: alpha/beta hydrolase [Deltaproteobacteria bacterium]|nr:MAG: alpha/beta hydrolase [Deltaproteobacteria bacterium]